MKNIDWSSLDGRSLRLFLAVVESGSVSVAADRLGMTQSAVSHGLDRLRLILRDPLFVRSGRGIVATRHAEALVEPVRELLAGMKALGGGAGFEPARAELQLTIAANDYQRDLLLPRLYRELAAEAPGLSLRIIPSGTPSPGLLRDRRCDLLITPFPPNGPDLVQKRLFSDRIACFYDGRRRGPPRDAAEFRAAGQIGIAFGIDDVPAREWEWTRERRVVVTLPNFAGIPPFLRGSELLAPLPGLLRLGVMKGFDRVPLPFAAEPMTVYMVWHRRNHLDPAQRWVRERLEGVAAGLGDGREGREE